MLSKTQYQMLLLLLLADPSVVESDGSYAFPQSQKKQLAHLITRKLVVEVGTRNPRYATQILPVKVTKLGAQVAAAYTAEHPAAAAV